MTKLKQYEPERKEFEKEPRVIWRQRGEGEENTWCADKINANDIKYIRADWITQVFAKRVERRMIKKMQKIMSGGVGGYLRSGGYIISQENWDKFKKEHE